jgi:hypothetical protein
MTVLNERNKTMNKVALVIPTLVSVGIGLVVNFFILRGLMRKLNRPQDEQQQTRLAAILAVLLAVPSVLRIKQLAALGEATPVER